MHWKVKKQKLIASTTIFDVEQMHLIDEIRQADLSHPFYRVKSADWVNVLATDDQGQVILVRQPRVGIMQTTLEVPGGMVDPDETPEQAAYRELEEETGYQAPNMRHIVSISPNPAMMDNQLHIFTANHVTLIDQRQHHPDENECIEVVLVAVDELHSRLLKGEINSALAGLTIMLGLYKPK